MVCLRRCCFSAFFRFFCVFALFVLFIVCALFSSFSVCLAWIALSSLMRIFLVFPRFCVTRAVAVSAHFFWFFRFFRVVCVVYRRSAFFLFFRFFCVVRVAVAYALFSGFSAFLHCSCCLSFLGFFLVSLFFFGAVLLFLPRHVGYGGLRNHSQLHNAGHWKAVWDIEREW